MLSWIRNQVIESNVKKRAVAAKKEFVAWADIKTICFLVSQDQFYKSAALEEFIRSSGKTGEVIRFVPSGAGQPQATGHTYTRKQLNLLGLPKTGVPGDVSGRTFDLLVDCNFTDYPSMKWLAGTTQAKFKVGPAGLSYDNYFDICIDLKNDRNMTNYLEQVASYLKMIRTKNA